jgi:hypothetical protein
MTTLITHRPNSPQLSRHQINNIIMFVAAIGIAAMTVATQPFSTGTPPGPTDSSPWRHAESVDPTPSEVDWCCLGSKPAERLGRGLADVGEVTSSVDNSPRVNPLAVSSVGLDPGVIDELIGGTVYPNAGAAHSSNNHVR